MTATTLAPAPSTPEATPTSATSLVTSLFSGASTSQDPADTRVSPRAAFQDALYGRTILIDLRPSALRAAEGNLPERLGPLVLNGATGGGLRDIARLAVETSVTLVSSDGLRAQRMADLLNRSGLWANAVSGGIVGWRSAGLPLAPAAAKPGI